jgi:hypothetical protein
VIEVDDAGVEQEVGADVLGRAHRPSVTPFSWCQPR